MEWFASIAFSVRAIDVCIAMSILSIYIDIHFSVCVYMYVRVFSFCAKSICLITVRNRSAQFRAVSNNALEMNHFDSMNVENIHSST